MITFSSSKSIILPECHHSHINQGVDSNPLPTCPFQNIDHCIYSMFVQDPLGSSTPQSKLV